MQERRTGDQERRYTSPPDTGKVLKETYDGKSDIGEKKYPLDSQS